MSRCFLIEMEYVANNGLYTIVEEACNLSNDIINLVENLQVSEPDNTEAFTSKKFSALTVQIALLGSVMVFAINFHNQPMRQANEINDIIAYGMLTPKMTMWKLTSKAIP